MTGEEPDTETPAAPRRGRWAIVVLLAAVVALNLMDRQLPFIMAESIRNEFALSDTQLGMLGGLAFSLTYAITAIPLARLADRGARIRILSICVIIWSGFTGMGAAAASFGQLMMTRIGVAVGEAGALPISHALVADLFPDRRRALAIGVVTAGIPLGVLLGLGLGGTLLRHMDWRDVLLLATLPGLLLGLLLLFFVREPARLGAHSGEKMPSFRESVRILAGNRAFVWINIGTMTGTFASAGGAAFGAAFLMREHGLDVGSAGLTFGLMMGLTGAVGAIMSGWLGSHLGRNPRWLAWLPACGAAIQLPFYVASWLVSDLHLAIGLQTIGWLAGSSKLALSYAAVQSIAPPRLRAFSSATLQLLLNLGGNVLGPIAVGMLSDTMGGAVGGGLGPALALTGLLLGVTAFAFLRAGFALPRTA